MNELDNLAVSCLAYVLKEGCCLGRYAPLVLRRDELINALKGAGIADSRAFLAAYAGNADALTRETGLEADVLSMLSKFFDFYRFRERKLSELTGLVAGETLDCLALRGIKTSGCYLRLKTPPGLPADEEKKIFGLCDLMRLPGVKALRAGLYYGAGVEHIAAMAHWDAERLRDVIGDYIARSGCGRALPLLKELTTQIAWAKALPSARR